MFPEQLEAIASTHLAGDAIPWFQRMEKTLGEITWAQFSRALYKYFVPPDNEDPRGALSKVLLATSVREYQSNFQRLSFVTPESFVLSCFISRF